MWNNGLRVRQDLPPGIIAGLALNPVVTCSGLNQTAVLEAIYPNPCG
ncbi:hypothetical protein NKT06_09810 [Paenibacillus sp. 1781tsa1]|nr:hypothetical protein [Paenibacillus sp. 1781tsa1]MCP1183315.1 hypothetical protein [Paenibacillus sp. 1781tsa1]